VHSTALPPLQFVFDHKSLRGDLVNRRFLVTVMPMTERRILLGFRVLFNKKHYNH